MIGFVRKRLSYANVAMTLALVLAMSGGAYAAKRYLITSTKQISPKVLKALKGARGPAGPEGKQGPAGAAGKDGVNGTNGKDGVNGVNGLNVSAKEVKPGEAACNKLGGGEFKVGSGTPVYACNGQTGFTETLPKGKTEKGAWAFTVPANNPTTTTPLPRTAISFVIPLEAPPTAIYLKPSEIGVEHKIECPGTASEPKATEGFLCVYAEAELNAPSVSSVEPQGRVGAIIGGEGGQPGGVALGSWAVTAE